MTGDCCIFKFLRRSVNGEHFLRFQSETSVFQFLWRVVDGALRLLGFQVLVQRHSIFCRNTYVKVSTLHVMARLFGRVELFFDSCEEMKAWIQEKDAVLSDEDLGRDLETVRALQRRHQVQDLQPEGWGGG